MTGITTLRIEFHDRGPSIHAQLTGHSRFPAEGLHVASISTALAKADPVLWRDFKAMLLGVFERVGEELCGVPIARVTCELPDDLRSLDDGKPRAKEPGT
ncbi:hypothetical protein [Ramlibacter sp.]|uniref:hypothetical protein n=1 Tax=Ramlibacter sp. TaxID=1917967 RepID=UPI003D12592E